LVLPPSLSLPRPPSLSTLFPYTSLFRSRDRLQREVVGFEALLDELVLGPAADGGAIGLVVHADDQARQHAGEGAVGRLGEGVARSEEHTSELQSLRHLVCRLVLEKKKKR